MKSESGNDAAPVASFPLYFIATVASFSVLVTGKAPVSPITSYFKATSIIIAMAVPLPSLIVTAESIRKVSFHTL